MVKPVNFKVYLNREEDSGTPEVRRFAIDPDVVKSFLYLRQKLENAFSSSRGKRYVISWKDSDGDNIVISNDEELQIALDEMTDEICKLYVTLKSDYDFQPKSDINKDLNALHINVTCDSCEQPVCGIRFKCIQCPNYDLCSKCQAQGTHPEHYMLRLVSSDPFKPFCGKRLARHMNKLIRKSSKHHGYSRQCPVTQSTSWIDTFASYLSDFANFPETPNESDADKPAPSESSNNEQEKKKNENEMEEPYAQLMKVLGKNLSHFLDPLGIDVKNREKNKEVNKPTMTPSASPMSNNNNTADPPVPSTSTVTETPEKNDRKTPPLLSDNETSTDEKVGEHESWTIINSNTETTASPVADLKKPMQPTTVMPQIPENQNPIYPELPKSEKVASHPNEKIQKALDAMLQMGFGDENGWLTNLLKSKDGDIIAVLDALHRR